MKKTAPLVYVLLFLCFHQFSLIAQNTITETLMVCAGESVYLPAAQEFPQPPIPPAGPGDPNGIPTSPCTPQLNQISVLPADNSLADGLNGFTVTPSISAIYSVHSNGLCGGPGTSEIGEKVLLYEVLVDTNCSSPIETPPTDNIKETFVVCEGATVFLPAIQEFPQPPQPPAGPDDPTGFPTNPCTPQLNQISITPTGNTLAEGVSGFTLTVSTSGIYTVTSNGLCGNSGSTEVGEIAVQYEILIDTNCEMPVEEIPVEEFPSFVKDTFVVCAGESVFLPAAQEFPQPPIPPAGPDDPSGLPITTPCTPQLSQISILPADNSLADGISGFTLTPTTTGRYTVTSNGVCGGPASVQIEEIKINYYIVVDATCSNSTTPSDDQIFTDFPWLTSLTTADCATKSIVVYETGGYNYLLLSDQSDQVSLYFQDGSFYCQGTADYDCLAAYSLSTITTTWNCAEQTNPPAPSEEAVIFTDFSWLSSIIDPDNCTTETIIQYETGGYHYLAVTDQNGQEFLYFQDGTNYCQSTADYRCVEAYGLTTMVSAWSCSEGTSLSIPIDYSIGSTAPVTKIFDYTACAGDELSLLIPNFGNCPLDLPASTEVVEVLTLDQQFLNVRVLKSGTFTYASVANEDCPDVTHIYSFVLQPSCTKDPIFTEFPWLNTQVNPRSCNGEVISVYESGGYQYVYIESEEGNALYFQNGDIYCTDSPNYDCRIAYNLLNPTSTWSCTNSSFQQSPSITQRSTNKVNATLNVFPNPVQHSLSVPIAGIVDQIQEIQLIDLSGRILQTMTIPANTAIRPVTFDMASYQDGVYFISLQASGQRKVQRVVKQKGE